MNNLANEIIKTIKEYCEDLGIDYNKLMNNNRKTIYACNRHILILAIRNNRAISLKALGEIFNRHHATIMNSCAEGRNLIEQKLQPYSDNYNYITNLLNKRKSEYELFNSKETIEAKLQDIVNNIEKDIYYNIITDIEDSIYYKSLKNNFYITKTEADKLIQLVIAVVINNTGKRNKPENIAHISSAHTFEVARREYPGVKRGFQSEYENFIKKNKVEICNKLLPAIEAEILYAEKIKNNGGKYYWKHFQTWINNKCWTQEFPEIENNQNINNRRNDNERRIPQQ